jgi:hypothetical protein
LQFAPRLVDKSGGIAVIAADGGDAVFVTTGGPSDNNPSWSPDGSLIAFDRSSSEALSVYTVRPDGTDLTRVVEGMDPAWQPLLAGFDSPPEPSPTPTVTEQGGPGLGFPVCNVSSVTGTFRVGFQGTAYVATKLGDGTGCPPVDSGFNVIAVDLDGDGVADTDYGPIECALECRAFSAPDLNGDGISELMIVQRGGTELAMGLYMMEANFGPNGVGPVPVEIAPPGDADHGFRPGRPALLFTGGDAGNAERLYCEGSGGHTLLWQTLGSLVPFDSPDAVWKVHEIQLTLEPDGMLHVFNTKNYDAPPGSSPFDSPAPTSDVSSTFPCVGS